LFSTQLNLFDTTSTPPTDDDRAALPSIGKWLDASDLGGIGGWPDIFGDKVIKELTGKGPKTISLFSGGGGLDIGFHQSGYDVSDMVEIQSAYVASLQKNSKKGAILAGSTPINIDIANYIPDRDGIEFVIGGPPCQTFSAAGRRSNGVAGTRDKRGSLFWEYVRILELLRPKGFLFENVYGITGSNNGSDWIAITNAFQNAGYNISSRILDTAEYGGPQHLERLIIVGLTDGEFRFPRPTHGPDSADKRAFYTAGDAVSELPSPESNLRVNGANGHLLDEIPPGLNYSYFTEEMGHPNPIFGWRSKFSDYLYKADPEMPVRTIKAQGGQYTGPFSWNSRKFTIDELKRLQTFPDDYEVVGGRGVAIEQIGNSVPPQFARILALSIADQIFGVKLPFQIEYMDSLRKLGFRSRKRGLTRRYRDKASSAIANLKSAGGSRAGLRPEAAEYERFLGKTHGWTTSRRDESKRYLIEISPTEVGFNVFLSKTKSETGNRNALVTITPTNPIPGALPFSVIEAHFYMGAVEDLTAAWKSIQEALSHYSGFEDLVAIHGYYQYRPKFRAKLALNAGHVDELLSTALISVTEANTTASTHHIDWFADKWGCDIDATKKIMLLLRSGGFEVRNVNTNPNIQDQHYLIPYSFPTLTPLSVQTYKKLAQ